jgi:hypothetical protein
MARRTAAAVLAAATLLTGCGFAADPAPDAGAAAVRSARVTTPGPVLYAAVLARMVKAGTATFTFSGSGGGQTVSGSGRMRFLPGAYDADVELTMPETGRVRAVLLHSVCYLSLPEAKGLPPDKPWLKVAPVPTSRFGKSLSPVVDQLRGSFDPSQALGLLQAARRVEEVGAGTVEGVRTTRHHAVIGLRRATSMAEGPLEEQYQSMLDAGVKTLSYDVWLDEAGLPRRFSTDIPTWVGLYSVTGIYSDWGKPVVIEQPSAKHVFDADDLEG